MLARGPPCLEEVHACGLEPLEHLLGVGGHVADGVASAVEHLEQLVERGGHVEVVGADVVPAGVAVVDDRDALFGVGLARSVRQRDSRAARRSHSIVTGSGPTRRSPVRASAGWAHLPRPRAAGLALQLAPAFRLCTFSQGTPSWTRPSLLGRGRRGGWRRPPARPAQPGRRWLRGLRPRRPRSPARRRWTVGPASPASRPCRAATDASQRARMDTHDRSRWARDSHRVMCTALSAGRSPES